MPSSFASSSETSGDVELDPYEEEYVQSGPGEIQGRGSGSVRIGAHYAVPF